MRDDLENRSVKKILSPAGMVYSLFTYALGVSVAHYLGGRISILEMILGLIICLLLGELRGFLGAYFNHPESYHSTLNHNDPQWEELLHIKRGLLLLYALLIMAAAAMLTMVLIFRGVVNIGALLWLGVAFLLNFFSVTPPLFISRKGYAELVEAIYITNLIPVIAYSMIITQPGSLILEITVPLTLVYLAMRLAQQFKDYGFDSQHGRYLLITRIGWQKALFINNIFILLAFILYTLFHLLGFPWSLTWPVLLTFPIGVLQIIYLQKIASGSKPNFRILNWLATGLFLLMVYLEIISLWL